MVAAPAEAHVQDDQIEDTGPEHAGQAAPLVPLPGSRDPAEGHSPTKCRRQHSLLDFDGEEVPRTPGRNVVATAESGSAGLEVRRSVRVPAATLRLHCNARAAGQRPSQAGKAKGRLLLATRPCREPGDRIRDRAPGVENRPNVADQNDGSAPPASSRAAGSSKARRAPRRTRRERQPRRTGTASRAPGGPSPRRSRAGTLGRVRRARAGGERDGPKDHERTSRPRHPLHDRETESRPIRRRLGAW
jgi:hypothetical protein